MEQAAGMPVELENAANPARWLRPGLDDMRRGARNLLAVTVAEESGTGLILNHQLVKGSTGMAGEFDTPPSFRMDLSA